MTAVIAADLLDFLSSSYFVTENEIKELAKFLNKVLILILLN